MHNLFYVHIYKLCVFMYDTIIKSLYKLKTYPNKTLCAKFYDVRCFDKVSNSRTSMSQIFCKPTVTFKLTREASRFLYAFT